MNKGIPVLEIPKSLIEMHDIFSHRGFKLYVVGGAVRNALLGRPVSDWDCATDAPPEAVLGMFKKVIPTGLAHGTVTVVHHGLHVEVTTFRLEGTYTDSRHPDGVSFTDDLEADLARRDFTINAMALDIASKKVIDPFCGQDDLQAGIIRTVGVPQERFQEDALRIVRALRFAVQLSFAIHEETWEGIEPSLKNLPRVSIERFREEFLKALSSPEPGRALELFQKSGVLKIFLPKIALEHESIQVKENLSLLDFRRAFLEVIRHAQEGDKHHDMLLCLTALCILPENNSWKLNPFGDSLRSLKLSNRILREGQALSDYALPLNMGEENSKSLRRRVAKLGKENLNSALSLYQGLSRAEEKVFSQAVLNFSTCKKMFDEALAMNPALELKDLAVGGQDLVGAGILAPGRNLGRALEAILEHVIDNPEHNQKEYLIAWVRTLLEKEQNN